MIIYSSDLFLDIFCVYPQSSDATGLIFQAKLTVCLISKKSDLYVWKKYTQNQTVKKVILFSSKTVQKVGRKKKKLVNAGLFL